MKILFVAHMWCPIHNAGGETTVHSAMREMVKRGHDVSVICKPQSEGEGAKFSDYEFEGVKVFKCPLRNDQAWIRKRTEQIKPDILITHLDLTTQAMQLAVDTKLPLAHWVHNTMSFSVWHVSPSKCQLAIFNSNWVAGCHKWKGKSIVLHPTVEPDRYRCERGTKITLVNPTPGKGADTFYALAKMLPDYEFLTVKSVYGEQIAPPNINPKLHPNVETMEHTADIREVFRKTKVLLMPSLYESYGRVAVEAACSGIPTIAHPTPGLLEALGDAGLFCHRDEPQEWRKAIERLYSDDVYYKGRSSKALKLAATLDPEGEFDRLEDALIETFDAWQERETRYMAKMWQSPYRLYYDKDKNITRDKAKADSLCCGEKGEITLEAAIKAGLYVPPAVQTEPLLDTSTLAKAVESPEENKAIEAPQEMKAAKKTRKRKVA